MRKLLSFLFLSTSVFLMNPQTTSAASMCPDKNTPPVANQAVGTSYRGGEGIVWKCTLVNGNAEWVEQDGVVFAIPNFSGFTNFGSLMSNLVQLVFFITGIAFFVNLVIGGIQWINAGGDQKAMQGARGRITSAVIGLIIVVAAYAITLVMGQVFGINIFGFRFK